MAYIVKMRPSDSVLGDPMSKKDARDLISKMESEDLIHGSYEPETYYMEEVAE